MKQRRVILSVTNDLVADKRVNKVCLSLQKFGFEVLIIGRKLPDSQEINLPYLYKRFKLPFTKGVMFYASFNIRLFFFLLFSKVDILLSNDLDTLPANFLVSVLRNKKLVYDSHELFTEVPELQNRERTKKIWLWLEGFMLPKLKYAYTVCNSIAEIYFNKYGLNMLTVRNIPESNFKNISNQKPELLVHENRRIIIYQGALNKGRGIEYAIEAMQFIENAVLLIVGGGDIEKELKIQVSTLHLTKKVLFTGKLPFNELWIYTKTADLGISLEENYSLNYYYALPNKLFDYIRAEIPILASNLPEISNIINRYKIGDFIKSYDPKLLAKQFEFMLSDTAKREIWKKNLAVASQELSWKNEEKVLEKLFKERI